MKTAITAFLAVFVISFVGIWGCAQQKNNAQAHKIRELEARFVKLEEDYRSVVASADTYRKKLARLDLQRVEQSAQLVEQSAQLEQLKSVVQERDDLKQKLTLRTTERDQVQTQLAQFSRELQSFASRVETATAQLTGSGNAAPVAAPVVPGKSN